METVLQTFLGVLSGGALLLFGQYLAHRFQRKAHTREQLLKAYSDLLGLATTDLYRAKQAESGLAIGRSPVQDEEAEKVWLKLEEQRHALCYDLARAAIQVRLLEKDPALAGRVDAMRKAQPFIVPGEFGVGNFSERFDKYQKDIRQFEAHVEALAAEVLRRYAA